jgi:hypothetical protein
MFMFDLIDLPILKSLQENSQGSNRVMIESGFVEKIGMEREGILRQHSYNRRVFMGQPIRIQGKKVVLRDLVEEDLKTIYYWIYEAEDREHLNWNAPYNPREPKTFEQFLEDYKGN